MALQRRLAALDLVCSGTLLARTKVCGKPTCRCATDPAQRQGPYYEWNRLEQDRLRHRIVSPAEARLLRRAMRNSQRVRALLAQWEDESIRIILGADRLTGSKRRS